MKIINVNRTDLNILCIHHRQFYNTRGPLPGPNQFLALTLAVPSLQLSSAASAYIFRPMGTLSYALHDCTTLQQCFAF